MKIFIGRPESCGLNYQPFYIIDMLYKHFEITEKVGEADIIVFPGSAACSMGATWNSLLYIRDVLREKKPKAKTYLTGCLARDYSDPRLKSVYSVLEEVIDYIIPQNQPNLLLKLISPEIFGDLKNDAFGGSSINGDTASLHISGGCLNHCSFCKTNYQKLPLISADLDTLKKTIDYYDVNGIKTINLLGINVCQYGLDINGTYLLPSVIEYIENKSNIQSIELTGFAFKDAIKGDFASTFKDSSKLKLIDGGLESGSDRILSLMNKGFNRAEFLSFVEKITAKYPKTFVLNIIAGFPTETLEDIKLTLDILKNLNLEKVNVIEYIDSEIVPSSNLVQLSDEEIEKHSKIYQKVLSSRNVPNKIF
ncbi:MAG: radical SAM protein [Bacilli bacterium]|nr:radical SAM protein [Bacilli bacterium]